MKLCSLSSGSGGNAIFVSGEKNKILIDCGISGKRAETELQKIGVSPKQLDGIMITHEHNDHISGVGVMMRKFGIPLYINQKTWERTKPLIGSYEDRKINIIATGESFQIGNLDIKSFSVSHDAAEPVGYTVSEKDKKISVATDIGVLEKSLFDMLRGSGAIFLEANHDPNMLDMGPYPLPLKQRIKSETGHLSNEDAGFAVRFLYRMGTEKFLFGHLSRENNYPDIAIKTILNILEEDQIQTDAMELYLAPDSCLSEVIEI